MVSRLTKHLRKLSGRDRKMADRLVERLIAHDIRGLNVKKLRGHNSIYRVRKGRLRIIYQIKDRKVIILDVNLRSDTTYKKY